MALNARDLEAAAAHLQYARATAGAVAGAYRCRFIGVDTRRFTETFRQAAVVDTRRFTETFRHASVVDTRQFTETFRLASVQIIAVASVRPEDEVSPREAALARALGVDWLFFGQLTLRALVLAIFLALVIAVWEEQRESTPAEALLEIVGAFGLWYSVDRAIWNKLS
jgi:hypothetical protein